MAVIPASSDIRLRASRYEPISIELMRRRCDGVVKSLRVFLISELAVGVLIRWVISLPKVDNDDEAMFCEHIE